ncbi:MAG: hypothetical protein EXR53_05705 [Dehalococcoidia bacterium]|nr:hypothetical protein [Dehalococcoidia bacterium]
MTQELGRIERPAAERFAGKRKLFLVPLAYEPPPGVGDGLDVLDRYWSQAQSQVAALESRLGSVQYVYHETVTESGGAGLQYMQEAAFRSYPIVQERCQRGAALEATEDPEVLLEVQDLQRCLMLPLASARVSQQLQVWLSDGSRRRYEHIAGRLHETLNSGDVGLLIISEHHQVQFPLDIEVFYVRPPALDEYQRWFEEWLGRQQRESAGPDAAAEA